MSAVAAKKPTVAMIDVVDIITDARYQRPVDDRRVKRIVENFKWDQFGVLELSDREGEYAIFDGQHRLAAARQLEMERVPCLIHRGLTPAEEAVLFTLLQTERRGLSQVDRFKAQVFAKDPRATEIKAIVQRHNYTVDKQRSPGDDARKIEAVATLERIYGRFGAAHLDETLEMIRDTWADDPRTANGRFIEGVALFLADYGDHRFTNAVHTRLTQIAPTAVLRRASAAHAGDARASQAANAEIRKVARVNGQPRTFRKPQAP